MTHASADSFPLVWINYRNIPNKVYVIFNVVSSSARQVNNTCAEIVWQNMAMSFKQRNYVCLYNEIPCLLSISTITSLQETHQKFLLGDNSLYLWTWYLDQSSIDIPDYLPPVSIKIVVTGTSDNCLFFLHRSIVVCVETFYHFNLMWSRDV